MHPKVSFKSGDYTDQELLFRCTGQRNVVGWLAPGGSHGREEHENVLCLWRGEK